MIKIKINKSKWKSNTNANGIVNVYIKDKMNETHLQVYYNMARDSKNINGSKDSLKHGSRLEIINL